MWFTTFQNILFWWLPSILFYFLFILQLLNQMPIIGHLVCFQYFTMKNSSGHSLWLILAHILNHTNGYPPRSGIVTLEVSDWRPVVRRQTALKVVLILLSLWNGWAAHCPQPCCSHSLKAATLLSTGAGGCAACLREGPGSAGCLQEGPECSGHLCPQPCWQTVTDPLWLKIDEAEGCFWSRPSSPSPLILTAYEWQVLLEFSLHFPWGHLVISGRGRKVVPFPRHPNMFLHGPGIWMSIFVSFQNQSFSP